MRLLHVFVCMNIYYTYSMYLRYEILMNIAAVEKARKHKTTSRFAPKGFTILCYVLRSLHVTLPSLLQNHIPTVAAAVHADLSRGKSRRAPRSF